LRKVKTDEATIKDVEGKTTDITVSSPRRFRTLQRSGKYDKRADHDHHDYEFKEGGEVHGQVSRDVSDLAA